MIREFLALAARAALQWALASLLLANGAAFCLIAAAAACLRLGPPCIACARVHRLLCSSSSATGDERDALRLLLCDAHLAAVAVARAASSAPPDRSDGNGVSQTMETDYPNMVSGKHSSTRLILFHPLNFFALKSVVSITPIYISITQ
jgi:hypothetical protein